MHINTSVRKGISPLIAAVILIAFTLAVGSLSMAWMSSFTEDTTDAVGDEGQRQVACSQARLDLLNTSWDQDNLSVTVANTGVEPLPEVIIAAQDDGNVVRDTVAVDPGSINSTELSLSGSADMVRVSPVSCPGISSQTTP